VEKPFVLLADDNEGTCTLIRAMLRSDFEVDVAPDGQDAIEKLRNRDYAVLLLDLLMPVVDGYGVLDHLAAERPDLMSRVIVVTASLSPRQMERVRTYDIFAVIPKPFDVDQLIESVHRCTGGFEARRLRGPLLSGGMLLLLAEMLVRRT